MEWAIKDRSLQFMNSCRVALKEKVPVLEDRRFTLLRKQADEKSIAKRKQSSARSASQVAHHRNLDKRDQTH
jgi:hypothetical protein